MTKRAPSAKPKFYKVHLQDELPAIGSGHRLVFAREGRKWVFILYPFDVTTVKMKLAAWERVKREEVDCTEYVINHMEKRLRLMKRLPTAFEKSVLGFLA